MGILTMKKISCKIKQNSMDLTKTKNPLKDNHLIIMTLHLRKTLVKCQMIKFFMIKVTSHL